MLAEHHYSITMLKIFQIPMAVLGITCAMQTWFSYATRQETQLLSVL